MQRVSTIERKTSETQVLINLSLDGTGKTEISTGYGMADHMFNLIAFWGSMDLTMKCTGDMHIDAHHTVEDAALCFGQAISSALGDRKGIARTSFAKVPMDEAIADVAIDFSGRTYLVYNGEELLPHVIAHEERSLWREFFKSLAAGARMNLHVNYLYGVNGHHLIESACKGLGLCIKNATTRINSSTSSTKGSLD